MSDYPPTPSFGASYGSQGHAHPAGVPQSYPNQYQRPEDANTVPTPVAANYHRSMSAYGYNTAMPGFSAATVAAGVPPLPIYQGWYQDAVPLPPYTSLQNSLQHAGYTGSPYHNTQSFAAPEQRSYHQYKQAVKPFEEGELSDGEFEDGVIPAKPTPVDLRSTQHVRNDGTGYTETAHRAVDARSQNSGPTHSSRIENDYSLSRDSPQIRRQRSDSYSLYASPELDHEENSKTSHYDMYSKNHMPDYVNGTSLNQVHQSWMQNQSQESYQSNSRFSGRFSQKSSRQPAEEGSVASPPATNHAPIITSYKSVAEARKKAQAAILNLWPLDVRFQNFIEEGLDETIVGRLLDDLGLPRVPSKSVNGANSSQITTDLQVPTVNTSRPSHNNENIEPLSSNEGPAVRKSHAVSDNPQDRKFHGDPLSVKQNINQLPPNGSAIPQASSSPSVSIATIVTVPKTTGATEKERTLKMKMDALRKSREERALRDAAKNITKPSTAPVPVVQPPPKPAAITKPSSSPSASPIPTIQRQTTNPSDVAQAPVPGTTLQSVHVIPGLFLSSSATSAAPSTTSFGTMHGTSKSNQRKRPVAADFDVPPTNSMPFKRPFGQSREDRPLVIDVSDDEVESDEDVAMDIESQADPESPALAIRKMSEHRAAVIQNLPPLSDFPPRKPFTPPPASSTISTPPKSQSLPKSNLGGPEDLHRKETEIERLKKRIAEAERRSKARQSSSGTHTPRVLDAYPTDGKGGNNASIPSKVDASIQMQRLAVIADNKVTSDQQRLAEAQAAELEKVAKLSSSEAERKRIRREKISSDLPRVDAEVQLNQMKLQELRAEIAKIEAVFQKRLEEKKMLADEMEKLGQEAEDQLQAQKDKLKSLTGEESGSSDASSRPTSLPVPEVEMKKCTPPSIDEGQPMLSADNPQCAEEPETGLTAARREAPVVPANGLVESSEVVNQSVKTLGTEQRDDLIDGILPDPRLEAALQETVRADAIEESDVYMEQSETPDPSPPVSESASSAAEKDNQVQQYSPVVDDTSSDIPDGESDNYEPPEATPPLDTTTSIESPPFSPAPPPVSSAESSRHKVTTPPQIIPLVTDENRENAALEALQNASVRHLNDNGIEQHSTDTEFFTPYESPLRLFRAYRFHPEFGKDIKGGLRSLTYSHKIDPDKELCRYELAGGICNNSACDLQHFRELGLADDAILTALGSPDEFSGEQRTRFCDGLKEVLTDLRVKKIKDFDIIAADIIAHRSRFLGDKSKVLMLEGTSL